MAEVAHEVMSSLTRTFRHMKIPVWFTSIMDNARVMGYTMSTNT